MIIVHDGRVEAAGGRRLAQLLGEHISVHEQEAERMNWKCFQPFEVSKPTTSDIFSSVRPHFLILTKQTPAGDQVFQYLRLGRAITFKLPQHGDALC